MKTSKKVPTISLLNSTTFFYKLHSLLRNSEQGISVKRFFAVQLLYIGLASFQFNKDREREGY